MAQNKNELKLNCLNNSVQFSPKLFSPNILLTDYSKNADNENRNNRKIRLIKKSRQGTSRQLEKLLLSKLTSLQVNMLTSCYYFFNYNYYFLYTRY